ncbi:MAG: hypothetical protein CUN51_04550 [Candidatus Thermofonsia Clade 1 bacterium]|uniref:Uncharacterized protein n=1 Tax=Candidatus Thermofonsia Clade 1 bacterium TaxID=2364210 RepID=A0A2M8P0S0_9CHLR|nr:MAG: hypothetical protein CUN51_04550 [Candidatus Thermofonsia Clade 1 bacterium]
MSVRNWRHGLYSREVPVTTALPTPLLPAHLADYFQSMAETCLSLAERLDAHVGERNGQIGSVISSLTRLAADLEQFSAVLRADGLRPSALRDLPDEDLDHLIAQQRRALELTLSRISLATNALLNGQPLRPDGTGVDVYRRLATLMRESKSIAKALASNLYGLEQRQDRYAEDLTARLYAALQGDEESEQP